MDPTWTGELIEWIKSEALHAGFDAAGVAAAPAAVHDSGQLTAQRFTTWLEAGHAGEMDYLKRRDSEGELLRASARVAMPWARSVIVCAMNYNAPGPHSLDPAPPDAAWIARYAWLGSPEGGPTDYHTELLPRLTALAESLNSRIACHTRCYVDTGPLLERDFAARAGVGWIGRNTCVIREGLGSWLLLGVIVTSLDMPQTLALEAPDRCGSCTRCIDACPTDALISPRQMDASLCIAYLTIEKKGAIAENLRAKMGRQVFGCDICQEVCPWNRRAPIHTQPALTTRTELINPSLDWLASLDDAAFKREFKGSPLERTKRKRVQRNAAIAMGNSAEQRFTPILTAWAGSEDETLAETAGWALDRLNRASALVASTLGEQDNGIDQADGKCV